MCLVATKFWPYIAKEDIPIRKILTEDTDNELFTPYYIKKVELNNVYRVPVLKMFPQQRFKPKEEAIYIHERGLHSFESVLAAFKNYPWWRDDIRIFNGYIPKGSLYWRGTRGDIVSNRIIYTCPVSTKDLADSFMIFINGRIKGKEWFINNFKTYIPGISDELIEEKWSEYKHLWNIKE